MSYHRNDDYKKSSKGAFGMSIRRMKAKKSDAAFVGNEKVITRIGKTTGRWPRYNLIVNGVDVGLIRRTTVGCGDRMTPNVRYAAWAISGTTVETQERAEALLIERATRFGHI